MTSRLVRRSDVRTLYENTSTYVVPTGSIQALPGGDFILAFREAPRRDRLSHIDPASKGLLLRSNDYGESWPLSQMSVIYDHPSPNCGVQDPAVAVLRDGTLIASFFQWRVGDDKDLPENPPPGRYLRRNAWEGRHAWIDGTWTLRSTDGGLTWEESPHPVETPLGLATTTSDPILELPNGELLLPGHGLRPDGSDVAFVIRSRDGGETWTDFTETASEPPGGIIFMEPSLAWIEATQSIVCMFRTRGGEYPNDLYQSTSTDLGYTWSRPERIGVWGGPPQLLPLQSGNLLCVYGYRREPYGVRAVLSVDGGRTWRSDEELAIDTEGTTSDLGYPAAIQRPDGTIFVTWYVGGDSQAGHGLILGAVIAEE